MAFNGFTVSLYNFITACHGIPKFIQPLPLNFLFYSPHQSVHKCVCSLKQYCFNLNTVPSKASFGELQIIPWSFSSVQLLYYTSLIQPAGCFHYLLQCQDCSIPLMIPTRCVQMYPVFGCATFVDVAFSITIHHNNMWQLWSIIICWCQEYLMLCCYIPHDSSKTC